MGLPFSVGVIIRLFCSERRDRCQMCSKSTLHSPTVVSLIFHRLNRLSAADSDMGDDMGGMGSGGNGHGGVGADSSLTGAARRATRLQLPGMGRSNTRSLFIFSEDNFIRKYAQIIIEWGYPFCVRR